MSETTPTTGLRQTSESRQPGETDIGRSRKGIAMAILLCLAAAGVIVYGRIEGCNNSPRGPEGGITLNDPDANKEVMCLRDLFHDIVTNPVFLNKWMAENCDMVKMIELALRENSLEAITAARDAIFTQVGTPAGTEQWRRSYQGQSEGFDMTISVDHHKLEQGVKAGAIRARKQNRQHSRQAR